MTLTVIRLPDIGEGIAEAEIAALHVAVGDHIREDEPFADIMTDKAAVEIPSSVTGTVVWIGGNVGDTLSIGAELLHVETHGDVTQAGGAIDESASNTASTPLQTQTQTEPSKPPQIARNQSNTPVGSDVSHSPAVQAAGNPLTQDKPLAAPSVRRRAREADIELNQITGTGPAGRITHDDLTRYIADSPDNTLNPSDASPHGTTIDRQPNNTVTDIKITGMRRKIAEQMTRSKRTIPHITIVEEVDVTELESLRGTLNTKYADSRPKLTVLPFIMNALVVAIHEQPTMNAHFDETTDTIHQFGGIHVGVATQTERGLVVPVVRHLETLDLWSCAQSLGDVVQAARDKKATREQLTGSTITITSLGALGAIATTPIINHPEVAIIGINRMAVRPHWDGTQFQPRTMMNISCSFDHRIIDGWDAAVFVHRMKELLEQPAMIFLHA